MVLLFIDATIVTDTPHLRAAWAPAGQQSKIPSTGNREKRVLYSALNPKTDHACLDRALNMERGRLFTHLRHIWGVWRGWNIVLLVDRGSPHPAKGSRQLTCQLGIEFRWLPTACPELNPMEGIWRETKGSILANEPTPDMDQSLDRVCGYILEMSPREKLCTAGILSRTVSASFTG